MTGTISTEASKRKKIEYSELTNTHPVDETRKCLTACTDASRGNLTRIEPAQG